MILRKVENVNGALLVGSAFFLPIISQISLILWITSGFFILYRQESRSEIISQLRLKPLLFLFPAFYLFHLAGLLWTCNFKYAGLDLGIKLPLAFVPLVVGGVRLSERWWKNIILFFVLGCVCASLIMLSQAFIRFFSGAHVSVFFYAELSSVLMHPTYASMFINIGVLFCLYFLIFEMNPVKCIQLITCSLFLLIMVILLSSRTAQVTAFLTILAFSIFLLFKHKANLFFKYGVVVCFLIALIAFQGSKIFNNRYEQVVQAVHEPAKMETYFGYNGVTGRVEIWREILLEYQSYWFLGVGTGDVKDELLEIYRKYNFRYGLDKNLNAHNQYLQTWFALGIPGITLLLLALFLPIYRTIRCSDISLIFCLSVIILNALTESIIEREKGVLLIVFIISFMIYKPEEFISSLRSSTLNS